MKHSTSTILTILNLLTWAIFISLCIKAGTLLYTIFPGELIHPDAARNLNLADNAPFFVRGGLSLLVIGILTKGIKFFSQKNQTV